MDRQDSPLAGGNGMYRLMVVDDEIWSIIDIRNSIDFASLHIECIWEFQDPVAAVVCAVQNAPDIIIVDLRMPKLSGIEFIRHIREQKLHSQIIILSGFQDFEVAREAMKLHVCGYCLKPIDADELTHLLLFAKETLDKPKPLVETLQADKPDPFVELVQYIDSHYNEHLSLEYLAKRFFLSPNHCSRLFAQRKHTTFTRYLMGCRLEAARQLLQRGDVPLHEIAAKVGFPDYFYFSRVFKKEFGMAPKDYRKQAETGKDG
ncbi:putative response regulatory protein [bioreactor metagenome]|uniref:Putative response regulatory protein n=1 Tax=bioreactor metagenome TaxID=1076179 RepID=A0A645AVN2_9ZZZZ